MPGPLERLRGRLTRDDAVSEVVSYTFMFGLGAVALVFSMQVMTDAQERGADIAAAKTANQLGEVTASFLQQGARAAHAAPNSSFETTLILPDTVGSQNYTIKAFVPDEPRPRGVSNDCWVDFWTASDLAGCADTHTGCPTGGEVRVTTAREDISTTVELSDLTTAEVTDDLCLVLDTQGEVHSSAVALRIQYGWVGNRPTLSLEPANR